MPPDLAPYVAAVCAVAILTVGIVQATRAAADAFRDVGRALADAWAAQLEVAKRPAAGPEQPDVSDEDELTDPEDEIVLRWEKAAGNVTEETRWAVQWALRRVRGLDPDQGTMEDAQQILRENGVVPFME